MAYFFGPPCSSFRLSRTGYWYRSTYCYRLRSGLFKRCVSGSLKTVLYTKYISSIFTEPLTEPPCIVTIIAQEWNDFNLAWNASDYGGITSVRIPPAMIWKPDILLYNRLHTLLLSVIYLSPESTKHIMTVTYCGQDSETTRYWTLFNF